MSDYIVSQIRTFVPLLVSFLLMRLGEWVYFDIDTESLISGLTAIVAAVYYGLARWLATRYEWAGWLLGVPKTPRYDS